MKRIVQLNVIICVAIIAQSCGSGKFLAPDFSTKTKTHKIIAVIPVQTVLSGNQPKKLTPDQVKQIEEAESQAFQASLYNCLLAKSGSGKKKIYITIQTIEKTNSILDSNGITLRDAWTKSPEQLAKILGVDAVVKTKVEKTRYMSDLASYGISLGQDVLLILTDGALWPFIPGGTAKTNDINADCSLLNGVDGSLLWRVTVQTSTDWSTPANQIIDNLNRKFARNFPYRKKK